MWMLWECNKRDVLSCKHVLPICSMCKLVMQYLFCTHGIPCVLRTNLPKDILSFTQVLLLYFTHERDIICILSFVYALRLYSIWWMLLKINPICWYCQRAVCAWILYCAISARYYISMLALSGLLMAKIHQSRHHWKPSVPITHSFAHRYELLRGH